MKKTSKINVNRLNTETNYNFNKIAKNELCQSVRTYHKLREKFARPLRTQAYKI